MSVRVDGISVQNVGGQCDLGKELQGSDVKTQFIELFGNHRVSISIIVGAVSILLLPVYVVAWKVSLCNMGRDDDFSGLLVILPATMAVGIFVGVSMGRRCPTVAGRLRRRARIRYPDFVAAIVVSTFTVIVCLVLSTIPSFILWFPDC